MSEGNYAILYVSMTSKKPVTLFVGLVGVLLVILAIVYWVTPAGSLPAFLPGYLAGSSTIHVKHGIGALLLGLAAFAYVWFQGGKKTSAPQQ